MANTVMTSKRKEPGEIVQGNANSDGSCTKLRKRGRPVWRIEVHDMPLSNKMLIDLEHYFINRISPREDKLLGRGFSENKEALYFDFQNESQQQAALGFDGRKIGGKHMRITRWDPNSDRERDEEIQEKEGTDEASALDRLSNAELKRTLELVQSENEAMHHHFRSNEGLRRQLEEAQMVADEQYHSFRDKEDDMRHEMRAMKDDLARYRRELKHAERENDDLCDRLKKKDKDIEDMYEDLKSSEMDNDDLYHRLKKRDKDVHNLEEEMKTMERIQQELKLQRGDSQRDNEHQPKRLRDIGEKVKQEMDGLTREMKSASQENDHLIRQLRTKDDQYNRDKDMLEIKLKRLQAENTLLRRNKDSERQMSDLEYQREQPHHVAVMQQQKEDKHKWYAEIRSEAVSRDLIDKMEKRESSTPQPKQGEQYNAWVRELEAKLFKVVHDQNVLLEENQNLRREKKDMQQAIAEWEAKEEETEQLREEIEQMKMNHAMEMGLMEGSHESDD